MRLLTSLAAAAAVALSLNASVAFADDENDENFVEPIAPQADTIFDLAWTSRRSPRTPLPCARTSPRCRRLPAT